MTDSRSPLTSLVLFIICIAIAATAVAAIHWYTIDLPGQQNAPQAPSNDCGNYVEKQFECHSRCGQDIQCYSACLTEDC